MSESWVTIFALDSGNWAEWAGAMAAGAAFIITSITLAVEVRRRGRERREAMFADALNVVLTAEDVSDDLVQNFILLKVNNGARHPITNVSIPSTNENGDVYGTWEMPFIQSGDYDYVSFFAIGGMEPRVKGHGRTGLNVRATLEFRDIAGTRWVRSPDQVMVRYPRSRLRLKGHPYNVRKARTPP